MRGVRALHSIALMTPLRFTLNGQVVELKDQDPSTPLLWVLRDRLGMTGTKFGCGIAMCGACTVHLDGVAVRSCSVEVGTIAGRHVRTIEGLAGAEGALHPLQEAWIEHDVAQCGYCQPGQLMQAAALLEKHPNPSDEDIDAAMSGNLCRCGTYVRIRAAIHSAAAKLGTKGGAA